jgi:hypothetical protein
MVDQAPPFPATAQKKAPFLFDGNTSIPAGTGSEHFGTIFTDAALANDNLFRKDFGKKSSLMPKMFIGALILIIFLAALYIALDLLGIPKQISVSVAPSSTPLPAPVGYLPAFIPRVTPDSAYTATHPGWERREADSLGYLIYRENGRIRAIQIIAGPQGVISVPFLKTCIRETTGREDADNWVRKNQDDFMIEKGTLRNKGELAVYRKMPEGDIRGFVLSFY